MKQLWFILVACTPALCDCIQLDGWQIRAGDLSAAVPAFSAADPNAALGYSPAPGVRRVMTPRDLQWAAHRLGIDSPDLPHGGVCLVRTLREVTEKELVAAMRSAFSGSQVEIDVVDSSHYAVPQGRLDFQLTGLNAPPPSQPETPVMWRGRVLYDERRSMEIWAKVHIRVRSMAFVAAADIEPGNPILPDQIRIIEIKRSPMRRGNEVSRMEQVTGAVARRPIRAGQEISMALLVRPPEIRAGDSVHVLATVGSARVSLSAVATSAGRKGDTIVLQNPISHTNFRAVVDGLDRAVINPGWRDRS